MREIKPPTSFSSRIDQTVFLAGGITGCWDWQAEYARMFEKDNVVLFNPRRDNFDVNDPKMSEEQIAWEYAHLKEADLVSFWFPEETLCPITLYELGYQVGSLRQIVVGCHPNYKRRFDVIQQLKNAQSYVQVVDSLEDLYKQAYSRLFVVGKVGM